MVDIFMFSTDLPFSTDKTIPAAHLCKYVRIDLDIVDPFRTTRRHTCTAKLYSEQRCDAPFRVCSFL